MQDNGNDCGVFLCKYLLAMYNLRYDSIPFCTLFGSETPLQFMTESVHFQFNTVDISQFRSNLVQLLHRLQLVYASSRVVFDDDVPASEEIMSEQELITHACDGHDNNLEDNFKVKFTSVNLEKEKVYASMKASFNEMLEKEYNRTMAGGTSMITKAEYDEFVKLLQQYPNAKKKSQKKINTRKLGLRSGPSRVRTVRLDRRTGPGRTGPHLSPTVRYFIPITHCLFVMSHLTSQNGQGTD
jgi:hypothetical protein